MTNTTLDNQVVYLISLINLASKRSFTQLLTASRRSGHNFLLLWVTGFVEGSTARRWQARSGCIPGISAAVQANRSAFSLSMRTNWLQASDKISFPSYTNFLGSSPSCTMMNSPSGFGRMSALSSLASRLVDMTLSEARRGLDAGGSSFVGSIMEIFSDCM